MDEVDSKTAWTVAGVWGVLIVSYMFTHSWMRVFEGIAVVFSLGIVAAMGSVLASFSYQQAKELYSAGQWLEKLDKRLDELEEKIKMNSHHIGHCSDANRRVEKVLDALHETIKADSKTMAGGAVENAVDEVLKSL